MIITPISIDIVKAAATKRGWTHIKREYEVSSVIKHVIKRGYYDWDENDNKFWVPEKRTIIEGEYIDYYVKGSLQACSVASSLPVFDDGVLK